MQLLTQLKAMGLPALYTTEGTDDPIVVAHLYTPDAQCNWWIIEVDLFDNDGTAFALCDLGMGFPELGYVDVNELSQVRGHLGLPVEIDLYWTPRPLSVVRASL